VHECEGLGAHLLNRISTRFLWGAQMCKLSHVTAMQNVADRISAHLPKCLVFDQQNIVFDKNK